MNIHLHKLSLCLALSTGIFVGTGNVVQAQGKHDIQHTVLSEIESHQALTIEELESSPISKILPVIIQTDHHKTEKNEINNTSMNRVESNINEVDSTLLIKEDSTRHVNENIDFNQTFPGPNKETSNARLSLNSVIQFEEIEELPQATLISSEPTLEFSQDIKAQNTTKSSEINDHINTLKDFSALSFETIHSDSDSPFQEEFNIETPIHENIANSAIATNLHSEHQERPELPNFVEMNQIGKPLEIKGDTPNIADDIPDDYLLSQGFMDNSPELYAGNDEIPRRVQLYYFRDSCAVKQIIKVLNPTLTVVAASCSDKPEDDSAPMPSEVMADAAQMTNGTDASMGLQSGLGKDELILIGNSRDRKSAMRLIAALDLPRPGIELQMWGVAISSDDPGDLAKVMGQVRQEINSTQQLVRETYGFIQSRILELKDFEPEFKRRLEEAGYTNALSANRPLSLSDIILRLVAAEQPNTSPTKHLADSLRTFMVDDPRGRFQDYLKAMKVSNRVPFERFLRARGLVLDCPSKLPNKQKKVSKNKEKKTLQCDSWIEKRRNADTYADTYAHISRSLILRFGLHYASMIEHPTEFDPYHLQHSSGELNDALRDTSKALNQDIEDLFLYPTLRKIQKIVKKFGDVEYAEAGRTTLAGLSGLPMETSTTTISAFDYTPPLSIRDLLKDSTAISNESSDFVNTLTTAAGGTTVPVDKIVSALVALEKDRTIWRQSTAKNEFSLTPYVLRNMASAELKIDVTKTDPLSEQAQGGNGKITNGQPTPLRPLSRISHHNVKTTIYADAVDFFAFSTFSNQNTVDGGRGYIPLIGPVWRGLFGEIPILGKLFSWKKRPKSVLHESLLLTNSFITPTPMGIALLNPISSSDENALFPEIIEQQVETYRNQDQLKTQSILN